MQLFESTSFLATATILLVVFGSFALAGTLQAVTYEETARGVDVYLLTSAPAMSDTPFTTDIVFTNDGTPLNVMEAEVFFDPTHVAVTDVTFSSDLCEERFIIDRVIDNEHGRVHLSCGTVTPFVGTIGVFASIHATPRTSGQVSFRFGENTNVYVADGKGTQIVRTTYDASVTLASGV